MDVCKGWSFFIISNRVHSLPGIFLRRTEKEGQRSAQNPEAPPAASVLDWGNFCSGGDCRV